MKRRYHLILIGIGLACAVLLLLIPALSQRQPYRLVCDIWPPYQIETPEGVGGFSTEMVRAVFSRLEATMEPVQAYPWKRAMNILEHGHADGLFSANLTQDRQLFARYPAEPLFEAPWIIWTRDARPMRSLQDLKGLTVGVVAGYSYTPEFWDFIETFCNVERVASDEINFRKLEYGRLDAAVAEYGNGLHLIRKLNLGIVTPRPDVIVKTDGLYIMFNRTEVDESFVRDFSEELKRFKVTEEYRALRRKYFGE